MKSHFRSLFTAASTAVALCFIVPFAGDTDNATDKGKNDTLKGYITGDFHTHTFLTDGAFPETTIVNKAINTYLLGWMANSEHGGAYATDPHGRLWDTISSKPFIRGDVTMSGGHRAMWRWQSLTEYSFPIINDLRDIYLNQYRKLLQSLEWNCPSHEHVSVGIMSDEPKSIGNFEYLFDQGDMDQSRNGEFDISSKSNITHADAVSALKWLQDNYSSSSYAVINHPSRKLKYSIADIRDFCNTASDVFIGLEGMPGHQKESSRGGYGSGPFIVNGTDLTYKARTYGGTDYMCAKIGGVWDALLSEGRKCWMFGNSDFHDTANDFWPGEYQKNYTYVYDRNYNFHINNGELLAGLRSGNGYVVQGDLIKDLQFIASQDDPGDDEQFPNKATMGQTLWVTKNKPINMRIWVRLGGRNNGGEYTPPHHIDLIRGPMRQPAAPGTAQYSVDTVAGVQILKTFTKNDAVYSENTRWYKVKFKTPKITQDCYFRLRGTNLEASTPNQTDAQGNPLNDDLVGINTTEKAYDDLWFYSNPIFIKINNQ